MDWAQLGVSLAIGIGTVAAAWFTVTTGRRNAETNEQALAAEQRHLRSEETAMVMETALALLEPLKERLTDLEAKNLAKDVEISVLRARVDLLEHTMRQNGLAVPNGKD